MSDSSRMCLDLIEELGKCNKRIDRYKRKLKRKEQECEKAKQNAQDTYDLWQALIESFNILQGEKIKLEQECEELKEINSTLLEYRRHAVTCQECYEDGLEDGKTSNKELRKLKQTLAEIKNLVEKEFCRHPECCEFCAISNDCLNQKIIVKINEVENEG